MEPRFRCGSTAEDLKITLLFRSIWRISRPSSYSPPAPRRLFFLMKVRFFVTGTAALLAVWLGATFLSEVPVDRYPQFGRGSVPVSAKAPKPAEQAKPVAAVDSRETAGASFE